MSVKTLALVALAIVSTLAAYHFVHQHHASQQAHAVKGVNPTALYDLFTHFKKNNNLTFGATEDKHRFNVFSDNYNKILEHNAKPHSTYKLGVTSLAHLTREEFAAIKLGYHAQKKTSQVVRTYKTLPHLTIADAVDWVAKGAVTGVKDQGQCGSCWAFSTTGSLEGLNFIKNKKLVSLSEQELVDCSASYGNQGCNGGLMDQGFQYVAAEGLAAEADYKYTAADGTCQKKAKVFKNKGFTDVKPNDPEQLQAAIANGPVSVAIEADTSAFQLYTSGVLTGDACGTQLDHGVLAVGYGTQGKQAYFKVKNSWGPSWGQKGYILIGKAAGAGVCGIQSDASYPTL